MGDLIDRQAAIDVLGVFTQADALGHTPKQIVEALPSAQPERKTGVWLDDDENGKVMTSGYCPYCSVCKEMAECITKYCPHCGAEMEGVEWG